MSRSFESFDYWLDWSRSQKGFMHFDMSGSVFQSESDLLSYGNKRYTEDTVLYVPNSVNQLCKPSSCKSGVQYQERKLKPYRSYINKLGKVYGLGYSETEEEAYNISMCARVEYIKELREMYKGVTDSRVWESILSEYWCPRYSQI